MSIVSVDTIALGDTIRFKTKSAHDNVLWTGVVQALCGYDIAKNFYDVDAYYADIIKTTPMPDKSTLTYVILKAQQNSGITATMAIAKEWIDESTLEKVSDEDAYIDIRLYNISMSKAEDIVSYIKAAYPGYIAEILD
jgi:hypothetical protein